MPKCCWTNWCPIKRTSCREHEQNTKQRPENIVVWVGGQQTEVKVEVSVIVRALKFSERLRYLLPQQPVVHENIIVCPCHPCIHC